MTTDMDLIALAAYGLLFVLTETSIAWWATGMMPN
jgi:hypothetical protein